MADHREIGKMLFCLGGLNPLCWTGCSSEEEVSPECYDDAVLKNNKSTYQNCKDAICEPIPDIPMWESYCGFYNFNGKCFPVCEESSIPEKNVTENYLQLHNKLCLKDGRGIRTEWEHPQLFSNLPSHYEKPEWCSLDLSTPENAWIPTAAFQPDDKEEFAMFLMKYLGWEIRVGTPNLDQNKNILDADVKEVGGTQLNTAEEVAKELSWLGAVPELGLEEESKNCGLLCSLMNSINELIHRPHLLKLLKNPEGHRFVFFAGVIPAAGILGMVHLEKGIESSVMVIDADKVMKLFLCAQGVFDQNDANHFLSAVISHELSHVFQNPPDIKNIPYVYEQLGFDYLYLFFEGAFDVYRLSPSLERGDRITHNSGGFGFVSGYDQTYGDYIEEGMESFAEEAQFYLFFRDAFKQYAQEDALQGDYFLATKYLFLAERLYCDDVEDVSFVSQK